MTRLLLLLLCTACAGGALAQAAPERCVAFSPDAAARIRSIRVASAIPQDNITKHTLPWVSTYVQRAPGYTGSITGAIIGWTIVDIMANLETRKALERATLALPQLVEAAKDFDFRGSFWEALGRSLAQDKRFRVRELRTFDSERTYIEDQDHVHDEPIDALLELRTAYALTADLRAFVMDTEVLLQSRPDGGELYRCRYRFSTPPVGMGEYQAAVDRWAAEQAALYRAAALIGIEQTMKMLRYDLTGSDAPHPGGGETRIPGGHVVVAPGAGVHTMVVGQIIEHEAHVMIVREEHGIMRAAWQGQTFEPPPEAVQAAAPASPGRAAGPVALDDLLGVLDEAPGAPPGSGRPGPEKAPPPPAAAGRATEIDDLGGLLDE